MKRKGFTLLELLVVISIIGIILSISISYFGRQNTVLKKEVFKVYSNLQNAKMYAIKNRVNVTITFYPNDNYYKIRFNKNRIINYHLDKRIEFGDVGYEKSGATNFTFSPLGNLDTLDDKFIIKIKLKKTNTFKEIIIYSLGGKIKYEE